MSKKDEKSVKVSSFGVNEAVKEKYFSRKYAEKEMFLNHDKPGVTSDSLRPPWDQTLRVREVMYRTDPEFPQEQKKFIAEEENEALSDLRRHLESLWQHFDPPSNLNLKANMRKRKLQQFLKDNLKRESQKLCDEQLEAKFRGHLLRASSTSSAHNMTDSNENLHKGILLSSLSSGSLLTSEDNFERPPCVSSNMNDAKDWYQSDRMTSLLVDITGSVHGSNPVTSEHIQEPESLHLKDGTNSSSLEESSYDCPPSQSNLLINFHYNQFERMTVPVGHHFQADVPEWCGPSSEVSINGESGNSRWLGTKVWPIDRQEDVASEAVGRGRPSSCSCASPGSTNCVRHHVLEKRCLLRSDLGPLFYVWKFDKMGEEVSESWTVKEQESFDLIAKRKSSKCNFFQNAMKSLRKCKKDITSYYFNVFIPRLMSSQTRSLLKEVDIDIDDVNDVFTLNIRRSRTDKSSSSGRSCKDLISFI